ncbi:hypothetical protein THRCLA_00433 [Thraustotheca clavata]|uniref:Uncharacterized protein n=1 Tax=Thraustotheca clavata TaxID=74557 RepID=A0A1W0AB67_9STRA|nr:hypothetical protein THRCLA_00433 [Thraustotheca clavata]
MSMQEHDEQPLTPRKSVLKRHNANSGKVLSKIPRLFKPATGLKSPSSAKKKTSKIPRMFVAKKTEPIARRLNECDTSSDGTASECTSSYTTELSSLEDTASFVTTLRELDIARCLQEDLLRDNAKLKQQAEFIHTEIGYQYELLTQIEAIVQDAHDRTWKRNAKLQRILDIIAAPMAVLEFPELNPPTVPDDMTF